MTKCAVCGTPYQDVPGLTFLPAGSAMRPSCDCLAKLGSLGMQSEAPPPIGAPPAMPVETFPQVEVLMTPIDPVRPISDQAQVVAKAGDASAWHVEAVDPDDLEAAHSRSFRNSACIEQSVICACFSCLRLILHAEIREWTPRDDTALCPRCGIDALVGSASGLPVENPDWLKKMHAYWFEQDDRGGPPRLEGSMPFLEVTRHAEKNLTERHARAWPPSAVPPAVPAVASAPSAPLAQDPLPRVIRPSFIDVCLTMAVQLSRRSTCRRLQTGCVITSIDHRYIFAGGYNGGAAGLDNDCESLEPGSCFPGSTRVLAAGVRAASRRKYKGRVVRVITAAGQFTVTPNHPVLALGRGLVPAKELAKGDRLLHALGVKAKTGTDPEHKDGVALEDLFETLRAPTASVRSTRSGFNLHGDCSLDERVDVVASKRGLWGYLESSAAKRAHQPRFLHADARERFLVNESAAFEFFQGGEALGTLRGTHLRKQAVEDFGSCSAANAGIFQSAIDYDLIEAIRPHQVPHGLTRLVARHKGLDVDGDHCLPFVSIEILSDLVKDPASAKALLNRRVADADRLGDLQDRLTGLVAAHEVIDVEWDWLAGHVYNLETDRGWYAVGPSRSIVKNCGHLHGEMNAIINCRESRDTPKHVYCTDSPCINCARALINLGGVRRVIYKREYRLRRGLEELERASVETHHVPRIELDDLLDNLTRAQERGTELLEETRTQRLRIADLVKENEGLRSALGGG